MEYVIIGSMSLPLGLFGDTSSKYGKAFEGGSKRGEHGQNQAIKPTM
jgi:hypothetical protein